MEKKRDNCVGKDYRVQVFIQTVPKEISQKHSVISYAAGEVNGGGHLTADTNKNGETNNDKVQCEGKRRG